MTPSVNAKRTTPSKAGKAVKRGAGTAEGDAVPKSAQRKKNIASGPLDPQLHEFGIQLKAARVAAGMSQQKLADIIGRQKSDISEIENGLRNITFLTMKTVSSAVGLVISLDLRSAPRKKASLPKA
jgi:ribosome-binding protein aMBF1 (putative translation factor)